MSLSHVLFLVFNLPTTKRKFNFISIYENTKVLLTKPFIKLTFHLSMMIHINERDEEKMKERENKRHRGMKVLKCKTIITHQVLTDICHSMTSNKIKMFCNFDGKTVGRKTKQFTNNKTFSAVMS